MRGCSGGVQLLFACVAAVHVVFGMEDRQLEIGDPELLLLLAAHLISGIKNEAVADVLREDMLRHDPSSSLAFARISRFLTLAGSPGSYCASSAARMAF
jgi:hypothetical protein